MPNIWPPTTVLSRDKFFTLVKDFEDDTGFQTRLYGYDDNFFCLAPYLAWAIKEWGGSNKMRPSPEVRIQADQLPNLKPGTTPIREYPDGDWLIRGQTGDCGGRGAVWYGDTKLFASVTGIGLEFAAAYCWKIGPTGAGHIMGLIVTPDYELKLVEPTALTFDKFVYEPGDIASRFHLVIL